MYTAKTEFVFGTKIIRVGDKVKNPTKRMIEQGLVDISESETLLLGEDSQIEIKIEDSQIEEEVEDSQIEESTKKKSKKK